MTQISTVSWHRYAQTYDLLMQHNPFYQQLHASVMEAARQWEIRPGDHIADLGAGTGNYSLALAQAFLMAHVIHMDNDEGMNARAASKGMALGLHNLQIIHRSVDDWALPEGSLRAILSVHALYTFPEPEKILKSMYRWLEPGGVGILVNAGRIVRVWDWQWAIGKHLLLKHGPKKTLDIMRQGKEVSKQNAYIREMQKNGTYWTHTHDEFVGAVQAAGFEVVEARTAFRGISDWVRVRKNEPENE